MENAYKAAGESKASRPGLAGTNLVHYGAIWDASLEREEESAEEQAAVFVCHGMGQQVRYETISSIAEAIRTEASELGGSVAPVEVHLTEANNEFLARAEIAWTDTARRKHNVHVYEAYWAPVTENRVSYPDTIKFLLSAGWNGLKWSSPFAEKTFERWMFDGRKTLTIGRWSFLGLLCVIAFVLLQVCIVGYVSLELAQQYRVVLSQPLPAVGHSEYLHAMLRWAAPLVPGHEILLHASIFTPAWWRAAGSLLLWIFLIAEVYFVRYFIVEYVGDVAAYISPYKDSKFDEIRKTIQKIGLDAGKVIYGFAGASSTVPHYKKVVIVGHSLGSVLAYDTLNALINLDNVGEAKNSRKVVERTRALITFGSPLDKTAFIFRMQPSKEQDWIREQMAALVQPLIVSYDLYRPASFRWINIWSTMDIISGSLENYDDPAVNATNAKHVQNMRDGEAWWPLLAHVQYWNNELLRKELYKYVS